MTGYFNEAHIKEFCGYSAFHRGMNYWQSGHVITVEFDEKTTNLSINSKVLGRRGIAYQQSITLSSDNGEDTTISGLCSCPMMMNCKHVAAVLLEIIAMEQIEVEKRSAKPVESWLNELETVNQNHRKKPSNTLTANANFALLYILNPDPDPRTRGLRVYAQKVRRLKRGGYGVPNRYVLEKIHNYYTEKFIEQSDKDIARLLASSQYYHYTMNTDYALDSDLAEIALKKMLASERCHWLDYQTPPLALSHSREITFRWEHHGEGQQLVSHIDPPGNQIFKLHQLWYLDLEEGQIGLLNSPGLDVDRSAALLDAPIVPNDELEQVSRQFIFNMPEFKLPAPVKLDIEQIEIKGEAPVIHLQLHSIENPDANEIAQLRHCARMMFGYGPLVLKNYSDQIPDRIILKDTIYLIDRDPDCEIRAMETLKNLGFNLLNPQQSNQYDTLEWFFHTKSIAESAIKWHEFIENDIPKLRAQGWQISIDDTFYLRVDEADDWHAELLEENSNWFSLTLGIEMDGERINLLPALVDLLSQAGTPQQLREHLETQPYSMVTVGDYRWIKLPSERLLPIFETLVELYDHEPLNQDGQLNLTKYQSVQIDGVLNDPALKWHGADELRALSQRLRNFRGIESVAAPSGFNTQLRPYQIQGLSWLQFMRDFGFNGILADDMGLGKTVQTLAHLLLEKHSGRMDIPSLVIAPTSLMGNWRRESEHFAPQLKVLTLHGTERHDDFDRISHHDLILTTYPLLLRDKKRLLEHEFHYLFLDESQVIKNPKSQTTQVVYKLKARHRICLTGTPMENHLGELWSMFHFLMPGFLGPLQRFNRLFRNPIERQGDTSRQRQLSRRVQPFLLRRSKDEVAAELPEKTKIVRTVTLHGQQRDLYETVRLAMDKKVRREIGKKGLARSHIMILDALLKLRQICCDPRLLSLPQAEKVNQSAKLNLLMEMLPEMVEEGRRILLFSQFTQMLSLIEAEIKPLKINYTKLTGQTRKRDEAIDRFQNGSVPLFLISLKAGGVGLNLTAADTVIHYDPWWNPAVENQATDRAHRIGQDKSIFVYKLITEETVEEKIIALQQKKQALADAIYGGKSIDTTERFSAEELTELLKPLSE